MYSLTVDQNGGQARFLGHQRPGPLEAPMVDEEEKKIF